MVTAKPISICAGSARWSRQLELLEEVGNALATETDLDRLLDLVVRSLQELVGARVVALALPSGSEARERYVLDAAACKAIDYVRNAGRQVERDHGADPDAVAPAAPQVDLVAERDFLPGDDARPRRLHELQGDVRHRRRRRGRGPHRQHGGR